MTIKQKHIGAIILIFLWLVLFFDNYKVSIPLSVFVASARTASLWGAYNVHGYYFPRLKESSRAKLKFLAWFIVLSMVMFMVDFFIEEPLLDEHHFSDRGSNDSCKSCDDLIVLLPQGGALVSEIIFTIFFSSLQVGIAMALSWTKQLFEVNKQNQLAILKLESLSKESELNELKNQLNPHFLFNALSNIYSSAYLGEKETPEKIMQLSKMLRYVIYETNVDEITIDKEIDYLNHYIEFQKFKTGRDNQVNFDYEACNLSIKIAPLILLPFIENAFKHSQIAVEPEAWIKIKLESTKDELLFDVLNTISDKNKPEILNNNGIGLDNQKKRLQLVYGDRYSLNITSKNYKNQEVFIVKLKIKLA